MGTSNLNPEQAAVVQYGTGPLRVVAAAGSGKTAALVERIAHLIEHRRVPVHDILMITFSRAAREEVAKRLDRRLPGLQAGACARTFHSVGLMIYRAETPQQDIVIDNNGLLLARACRLAADRLRLNPKRAVLTRFRTRVKNDMLRGDADGRIDPHMVRAADRTAQDTPNARVTGSELLELYFATEDIRTKEGVVDRGVAQRFVTYDDMIYEAALLLERSEVRDSWARRWKWVLADEAQDTNTAQAVIARALVSAHRNYTIVGDVNQAIYGWRSATPRQILDFDKAYPGARTILMHRNYRSGIEICAVANRIAEHMPASSVVCDEFGHTLEMHSERQTHAFVTCHQFSSETDEAESIADNIIAHRAAQLPWEDQAVLVRMNRMTRDVEIALAMREVPYRLVSGSSFFTMPEAECLLGYMRLLADRPTSTVVAATLRYPSRKLRRTFIDAAIGDRAVDEDWLVALRRYAAAQGKPHEQRGIEEWARFIEASRRNLNLTAPGALCRRLRVLLDLDTYFGTETEDAEDSQSLENLNDVTHFAAGFTTTERLIDTVERVESHRAKVGTKRKAVTVSTIHKSKGLEWNTVYVPQLSNGLLPVARADVSEERRVFYVACTRAEDELWLSWTSTEETRDAQVSSRSSFLDEAAIPDSPSYEPGRKVDDVRIGSQLRLLR